MEDTQRRRSGLIGKILAGVVAVAVIVIIASGAFILGRSSAEEDSPSVAANGEFDYSVLNDVRNILGRDYVKPENIDDQTLFEAAVNGMLGVLNDYGTYYMPREEQQIDTVLTGQFDGIGAEVVGQNGQIIIVAPIKDSPAEKAGLQSGDVILEIDGETTEGLTVNQAVLKIRGSRGSKVELLIRHTDNKTEEYTLTRDRIIETTVSTTPPGGSLKNSAGATLSDIGYIEIEKFTPRTDAELAAAVKEHMSKGVKGLIIDVRSNLGGLLDPTVRAADLFLNSGTIVIQRDADGNERKADAKNDGDIANGVPIVVLQNRYSASGSEILAAALRDNGRATIVGEKSFGKGTVNVTRVLDSGAAIRVSIAQWLTPNGQLLDHFGVLPDVDVSLTDEDIDLRRDGQLIRAVDVLSGLVRR